MKALHVIVFGPLDPLDDGYKTTAVHLLRILARHLDITLFRLPKPNHPSLLKLDGFDPVCAELGIKVVRVALHREFPAQRFIGGPLAAALSTLSGQRRDWVGALKTAGLGAGQTQVLCFGIGWDSFATAALQYFAHSIFFPLDSITLFEKNRRAPGLMKRVKQRAAIAVAACMERQVARATLDRTLFVSPKDAACVARLSGSRRRVAVVPLGIDPAEYSEPPLHPNPPILVFSGVMDYLPNKDAALFLIEDIFPRVRTPGVRLRIVGKGAARLNYLARERVEFLDWVPSMPAALRACSLFVCPLRMGAGAKSKVVQALASGLPVVGTPNALSGFSLRPPGTFICRDATTLANKIDELLADPAALAATSQEVQSFALRHCTWEAAATRLLSVIGMDKRELPARTPASSS